MSYNSGAHLVVLASIIAILLAEKLSTDDIEILAALLTAIGDNLAVIAVKRGLEKVIDNIPAAIAPSFQYKTKLYAT